MGTQNLNLRVDLLCNVDDVVSDGFTFTIAIEPEDQYLSSWCICPNILGDLSLLVSDRFLQWGVKQIVIRCRLPRFVSRRKLVILDVARHRGDDH